MWCTGQQHQNIFGPQRCPWVHAVWLLQRIFIQVLKSSLGFKSTVVLYRGTTARSVYLSNKGWTCTFQFSRTAYPVVARRRCPQVMYCKSTSTHPHHMHGVSIRYLQLALTVWAAIQLQAHPDATRPAPVHWDETDVASQDGILQLMANYTLAVHIPFKCLKQHLF